jgi:ferredoxin
VRVELDRDLCQGHAMCVAEAPNVFELRKHDDQVTILVAEIPEAELDAARRAVAYCPNAALSLLGGAG